MQSEEICWSVSLVDVVDMFNDANEVVSSALQIYQYYKDDNKAVLESRVHTPCSCQNSRSFQGHSGS